MKTKTFLKPVLNIKKNKRLKSIDQSIVDLGVNRITSTIQKKEN
jgi:hypothetical protein